MAPNSPKIIPTLYDETFRGVAAHTFNVATVGDLANLIGHLEHHSPDTDGSFGICVAGGTGALVSKALWESIPEQHRPPLNTIDKGMVVPNILFPSSKIKAIGSVIFPILLRDTNGKRFRMKLFALVVPEMQMGMFLSMNKAFIEETQYAGRGLGPEFTFNFDGQRVKVQGVGL